MPIAADSAPRLLREPAIAGERERAEPAEAEVAERDRQAGEAGGGGAGEGDHRERVPGEGLPAEDHEPAGDAGHDGDDRPRLERVDHERERERAAGRR